jgi:hypothetical protein
MALKPEVSLQVAALTSILVYGIFAVEVGPSVASVKNAQPHNSIINGSVRSAAITSTAVVAGISLLSKDFTVFIVGGAVAAALTWKYKHASMTNPATGQVTFPPQQGTPQQNQAPSTDNS